MDYIQTSDTGKKTSRRKRIPTLSDELRLYASTEKGVVSRTKSHWKVHKCFNLVLAGKILTKYGYEGITLDIETYNKHTILVVRFDPQRKMAWNGRTEVRIQNFASILKAANMNSKLEIFKKKAVKKKRGKRLHSHTWKDELRLCSANSVSKWKVTESFDLNLARSDTQKRNIVLQIKGTILSVTIGKQRDIRPNTQVRVRQFSKLLMEANNNQPPVRLS